MLGISSQVRWRGRGPEGLVWAARKAGPSAVSSDTALAATEEPSLGFVFCVDQFPTHGIACPVSGDASGILERPFVLLYRPLAEKRAVCVRRFAKCAVLWKDRPDLVGRMPRGEGLAKKKKKRVTGPGLGIDAPEAQLILAKRTSPPSPPRQRETTLSEGCFSAVTKF